MDMDFLKNIVLFKNMSEEEIYDSLSSLSAMEKTFKKDETVLFAGEKTKKMGIVLQGSVTIESNDQWGNCMILSHVGKGGFFAETYAFIGEIMLVDVRANEESRILFINTGDMQGARGGNASWKDKLIANLLKISMQKNIVLSQRSFHTSPKTIREKILSYLNTISLKKQSAQFQIPFNRQQLADYLNVDRTALSKELGKMADEGIISFKKSYFEIL